MRAFIAATAIALATMDAAASKSGAGQKRVVMVVAPVDYRDEELETPRRVLEDGGVRVEIASSSSETARGVLGGTVAPDMLVKEIDASAIDGIIFVGGAGAENYWNDADAHAAAREAYGQGKVVGGICSASVVLANAGILKGKKATVWPSEKGRLTAQGALYTREHVAVDGRIVTGDGPKYVREFGRAFLERLND